MLEGLGRAAAELHGSEAGVELGAQGSLLFMGGTEAGVPHGSTEAAGLGTDPGEGQSERWRVRKREGGLLLKVLTHPFNTMSQRARHHL